MNHGPGMTARARPSRASQMRVIWSPHVVATSAPSGLNATPVIDSLCPPNLSNSSFEPKSQSTSERPVTLASLAPPALEANSGATLRRSPRVNGASCPLARKSWIESS